MPFSEIPPGSEILVVDDERFSRRILVRALEHAGFTCRQGEGGEEALRLVEEKLPALLLLDYAMPGGLNGAEVCERLRAHPGPRRGPAPVIMLTGMSGEEQEVFCLQAGASDFVTKPVNPAVLKARIDTQLRLSLLRTQLETRNQELADWRAELERDLEAARLTQQSIIPQRFPSLPGWDVATHYQPVIQVGGDIFDWLRLPDGRSFFWIADATGHGASAALHTALAKLLFPPRRRRDQFARGHPARGQPGLPDDVQGPFADDGHGRRARPRHRPSELRGRGSSAPVAATRRRRDGHPAFAMPAAGPHPRPRPGRRLRRAGTGRRFPAVHRWVL